MIKKILIVIGIIIAVLVIAVGGYVGYVYLQYYRIKDNVEINIDSQLSQTEVNDVIDSDGTYSIMTYNLGFGAYSPDFDFFMDEGTLKDETKIKGSRGTAIDKKHVEDSINGALQLSKDLNTTFNFFQEVDTNSTRSYHINQYQMAKQYLNEKQSSFAVNFHSAYLFYPFNDPHGKVNSGIATFSKYKIESSTRYSFDVSKDFSKFFDLDRCFSVSYVNMNNGKKLALINLHMSAYDKGGVIRAKQMKQLEAFLSNLKEENCYVIAGGDFNHDLITYNPDYSYTEDSLPFADSTIEIRPDWVSFFFNKDGTSEMPSDYKIVAADNAPTCRSADMAWQKGKNFVTTIDGFIVSDNIEVIKVENINNDFAYSDHQPVLMQFKFL